jgi:hypothetical protein
MANPTATSTDDDAAQSSSNRPTSFGVYKPVGHLVISFPTAQDAQAALAALEAPETPETPEALSSLAIEASDIHTYSDTEMVTQVAEDLKNASPLAAIGQEINLLRSHGELAERGYHFLVVKAKDDEQARQIAQAVRPHAAERAQYYGHFIIEEMIEPAHGPPQVAESPDRGLDADPKPPLPTQ